jgi:hypothetical protein
LAVQVVQVGQTAVFHQTLTVLVLMVALVAVSPLLVSVVLSTLKGLVQVCSLGQRQAASVTTAEMQSLVMLAVEVELVALALQPLAEL